MALPAAVITLFIGCLYIGSELSVLEAFATESTLSAGGSKLPTQKAEELQATLGSSTSVEGDRIPEESDTRQDINTPSLVFIKMGKVGGSTAGGVMRRIGEQFGLSGTRDQRWVETQPGVWANHGEYSNMEERIRQLGPRFVISWVRHPVDRCLSHFYHLELLRTGRFANITDDSILEFARRNCSNYMAGYLGKPHDSSAEEILRRFDFVGTTERFDESMILLGQRLPMPVTLGDVLYVKAKKSSAREKRGKRKGVMHKPYAQQSKRVRDFFDVDFKARNHLDFALYRLVNTALDDQGKAMGLKKLARSMSTYIRMLAIANEKCANKHGGKKDCFWKDNGCSISCLDNIGTYSYVRNTSTKRRNAKRQNVKRRNAKKRNAKRRNGKI